MQNVLPPPPADEPLPAPVASVVDVALSRLETLLDDLRAGLLCGAGRADTDLKADGTPVTAVDVEVDRRIRDMVGASFPDHDVVSEELDAVAADAEWHWVVDPIDGTSNFAAGLPHWCISVALCHLGRPVMAVVDAPDLDQRWTAVAGRGAWRSGRPVRTREIAALDDPATSHLPLFTTLGTLVRANRDGGVRLNPRIIGSMALEHTLVADGVGVAAIALAPRLWDVAAAALLVHEAGGAMLTFGEDLLLPVVAGTDYTDRAAPAFTCTSPERARDLLERLTPAGGWNRPTSDAP